MPEPKGVVYLLRHAHDYKKVEGKKESDLWDKPSDGGDFSEKLPDGREVKFPWKRLSEDGRNEAECIKGFVAQAATENGKYAPIHHFVAQDPNGREHSQNTFYTIWPALNNDFNNAKINLLGLDGGFSEQSILDLLTRKGSSESIMICLDRQCLWGYKRDGNGKHIHDSEGHKVKQSYDDPPEESSILGQLDQRLGGALKGKLIGPEKGGIIYKFTTSDDGQSLKISSLYLDRSGTTFKGVKNQKEII